MEQTDRLTAIRGEVGGEDCMKEGEGMSQGTYMHNPKTQTTVC